MVNSTHRAEVVEIVLQPHPDPETTQLSIVKVWDYTVVVNTKQWEGIQFGVYICPDTLVNTDLPEFAFLKVSKQFHRVAAKRLRGVYSLGLLIPAPEFAKLGDDLFDYYGLIHYEPEVKCEYSTATDCVGAPPLFGSIPKYDIDAFRKYSRLFNESEKVFISEKVHGGFMRVVYSQGELYVGSRTQWKKKDENSCYWKALPNSVEDFCRANENLVVCGECTGIQKGYTYGLPNGEVTFLAFDIMAEDFSFFDAPHFLSICSKHKIETVPQIGVFDYNFDKVMGLADGPTLTQGKHIREGIVIRPEKERSDIRLGRVILKLVSNKYLEKS